MRVRMTTAEVAMLRDLADADGVSASDVVRLFIRRAHAERFGVVPATSTRVQRREVATRRK